jgi:LmbE family N-acetylglucosaminyl deacetylase
VAGEALPEHVVVVSPHLDDAVLSLGATIRRHTRAGGRVEVLTVFSGDPASDVPAGEWDRQGGFATEGEATRGRRAEDTTACERIGARPVRLGFRDSPYDATRDAEVIRTAVMDAAGSADAVLMPGFPFTNTDHAWLSEVLLREPLPARRVGLYAEQPYRYWVRETEPRPAVPALIAPYVGQPQWVGGRAGPAELRAKRAAIRAYRSQQPMLKLDRRRGLALDALLLHEWLRGGEAIAWIEAARP